MYFVDRLINICFATNVYLMEIINASFFLLLKWIYEREIERKNCQKNSKLFENAPGKLSFHRKGSNGISRNVLKRKYYPKFWDFRYLSKILFSYRNKFGKIYQKFSEYLKKCIQMIRTSYSECVVIVNFTLFIHFSHCFDEFVSFFGVNLSIVTFYCRRLHAQVYCIHAYRI